MSGLASWSVGDLDAAHASYLACVEELTLAGHISDVLGCTTTLADLRVTQGRLRDAQATLESALALAAAQPGVVRGTADMHAGLAAVFLERGEIAQAESHLRRCQELGEAAGLPAHPYRLRVTMALTRWAHGERDEAIALLEEAERVYVGDFLPNVRPVHALRARLLVADGRLTEAHEWAAAHGVSDTDELTYLREYEHVTYAGLLLADHRVTPSGTSLKRASTLLRRLGDAAETGGRVGTLIEILALRALCSFVEEREDSAIAHVQRAVTLAAPHGYSRALTQQGADVMNVLRLLPSDIRQTPYVRTLMAHSDAGVLTAGAVTAGAVTAGVVTAVVVARQATRHDLVDPLSHRELEVLRLLATDLTGPELARHLVVSLNTLRTHTRNVYAKLGVSGRRAAVSRARELDLLGRRET